MESVLLVWLADDVLTAGITNQMIICKDTIIQVMLLIRDAAVLISSNVLKLTNAASARVKDDISGSNANANACKKTLEAELMRIKLGFNFQFQWFSMCHF
jgi:ribosomal protein L9